MQQLDSGAWAQARKLAKALAVSWLVVQPSQSLLTRAEQLVDDYDLRAPDSLQLAAALVWCGGRPDDRLFLTGDQRLRAAAELCGFEAISVRSGE